MRAYVLLIALLVAACGSASATRAPNPTDRATPEPVITDEPFVGIVTFGLDYDPDTLEIIKPTVRFKATYPEIAYAAWLSEPAQAATLRLVVASQSPSGSERVIIDEEVPVSNPDADLFANKLDLATLVGNEPGTYVMRYLRDADVLAEGTFTLVK